MSVVEPASGGRYVFRAGLLVLFGEPGERDDPVVGVDLDQAHALRRSSDGPDIARNSPQDLALLRDEHELILVVHRRHPDNPAVPFGCLDVNNTHTAPGLHPIFIQLGAFSIAVLGDGQQGAPEANHLPGDHRASLAEAYSTHAVSRTPPRPGIALRGPRSQ